MAVSTIDALYNGTSEKLTTSATGITVTGTVAATAYTGDGSALTGVGSPSIDDNGVATVITIDSSDRVLTDTTNISATAQQGNSMTYDNGRLEVQKYRASALKVGNYTDGFSAYSGDLIGFYSGGATVGSIGVLGGNNLTISGTQSNHCGLSFATNAILPTTESVTNNNTVDMGANGNAYKDLYIGGGIYLGGVGSANKLEDYEEGTWTPSNASVTISINDTAKYTKVGNLVTVTFYITFPNISSGASCEIFGLPFVGSKYATGTGNSNSSAGGIVIRSNLNGSSISVMGTSNNNISVGTLAGKILIGTISYETSQ